MPYGISAQFEAQKSLGFASIGATYAPVGSAFLHPIRILYLLNLTDGDVQVSFDGINDHLVVPNRTNGIFPPLYFTQGKVQDSLLMLREGTVVYVKDITATTAGAFYVCAVYGFGD